MTSQILITKPLDPVSAQSSDSNQEPFADSHVLKSVKTHYHSDHQEEFLDISAQIESLLSELQTQASNP
ncbi:MAG: hypothetical protein ACFCU8_02005 [Thermosynechococcaceae cyanobacterium]